MGFSIYVHIPYCLQRCRYCDFTTFESNQILPPDQYVSLVRNEIRKWHRVLPSSQVNTIYFGGGTPSLLPAGDIVSILDQLANVGLSISSDAEITIEINPATVDEGKLHTYLTAGFNRFSVGAQTFDDQLLKLCGRRHSAEDTRRTLKLLNKYDLNYSFDLLFALPGQTLAGLKSDLDQVADFNPRHLSPYCLTVPEGHPMFLGRPPEDSQVEMFHLIEDRLKPMGLDKYEISNFAQPGFESRHNFAYWSDLPYWGIGLSSHSYFPKESAWGLRFWNTKSLDEYSREHSSDAFAPAENLTEVLLPDRSERLNKHESLTDYVHMHLRTARGLSLSAVRNKYGLNGYNLVLKRAGDPRVTGLIEALGDRIRLTRKGQLLSNVVFSHFLVSKDDLGYQSGDKSFTASGPIP